MVYKVGRRIKLLAELDSGGIAGDDYSEAADGGLFSYGVRFFTGEIAGDVGLIKLFCTNENIAEDCDGPLVLGYPWLNFSYRWQ